MIDIEPDIFDIMCRHIWDKYPDADMNSITNLAPSTFPSVSIEEVSNIVHVASIDSDNKENHANIGYEVNVFTTNPEGKRSEAREILKHIDSKFSELGFVRTSMNPTTMNDGTMLRIVSRYIATVGENGRVYRG